MALSLLLALCVWLLPLPAAAKRIAVPARQSLVTDLTGTLSASQVEALRDKLDDFHDAHQAQLAVLVVPTTGEDSIESFATRVFDKWKLGSAKHNDGLLLLVALKDRRMRIEVGQGLEGQMPDVLAGRIVDQQMMPRFKQQDYYGGIDGAVDALIERLGGGFVVPPSAMGQDPQLGEVIDTPGEPYEVEVETRSGITPFGWAFIAVLLAAIGAASWRWRFARRLFAGLGVLAGVITASVMHFGGSETLTGIGVVLGSAVALFLLALVAVGMRMAWRQGFASFAIRWVIVLGLTAYVAWENPGEWIPAAMAFGISMLFAFFPGSVGGSSDGDDDSDSGWSSASSSSSSSSSSGSSSSSSSGGSSSGGGASGSW